MCTPRYESKLISRVLAVGDEVLSNVGGGSLREQNKSEWLMESDGSALSATNASTCTSASAAAAGAAANTAAHTAGRPSQKSVLFSQSTWGGYDE